MKRTSSQTNDPEGPRRELEIDETELAVEDSYDGPDLTLEDKDEGDSDDGYRPFYWYNRDYNIPDECRFYL